MRLSGRGLSDSVVLRYKSACFLNASSMPVIFDADVITMTFIVQLMDTIKWIDEDASGLSREDILDKVRARLVDITHKFVAYPHCANFSLMPEGGK